MDDTVVTNDGESIYMVVNGACKYKVSTSLQCVITLFHCTDFYIFYRIWITLKITLWTTSLMST